MLDNSDRHFTNMCLDKPDLPRTQSLRNNMPFVKVDKSFSHYDKVIRMRTHAFIRTIYVYIKDVDFEQL